MTNNELLIKGKFVYCEFSSRSSSPVMNYIKSLHYKIALYDDKTDICVHFHWKYQHYGQSVWFII